MTASRTATAAIPPAAAARSDRGRLGSRRSPASRPPEPPTPPAAETTSPTVDHPASAHRHRAPGGRRARIPRRTCSRIASCGRPIPAMSARVSIRRRASSGELACTVESAPSWPGVERGQEIESLGAAHLPDHDPVGTHPKRVPQQVADRDLSPALDARRPALEPDHVRLAQAELGGVLDRDHPLRRADVGREGVEQGRLARSRAAGDQDAAPRRDRRLRAGREARAVRVPRGDELVGVGAARP